MIFQLSALNRDGAKSQKGHDADLMMMMVMMMDEGLYRLSYIQDHALILLVIGESLRDSRYTFPNSLEYKNIKRNEMFYNQNL
jgi:hypothetical protein